MDITPEKTRYINERGSYLSQLLLQWIDRVLKYPFHTNAGGTIAVLSFMGASESVRAMAGPKWALACFATGIVLYGLMSAYQIHHTAGLYGKWRCGVSQYMAGEISWEIFIKEDEARSHILTSWVGYVFGYGSFLCFSTGSVIGLYLFFTS